MRSRPGLLLAAVFLIALAGCGGPATGASSTSSSSAAVLPFDRFVADTTAATYADYAGKPGVQVKDEGAFRAMRTYVLSRYADARVPASYADNGAVIDCVTSAAAATGGAGQCPAGSVPVRRITLADLTRFATVEDFLAKAPGGGELPPVPSS